MPHRNSQILIASIVSAYLLFAPPSFAAKNAVLALRGARIESMAKAGCIEGGTVVVRDGKIEAVGTDVKIPDDARIIDARGKTILPGIIDPYYAIRIGTSAAPATRTITIRGRTFTVRTTGSSAPPSFARVIDGFYPYDINFRPLLRSGITDLNIVANGYGQAALARLTMDDPEAMIFNGEGLVFAAVSNDSNTLNVLRNGLASAKSSSGTPDKTSSSTKPTTSSTRPPAPTAGSSASSSTSSRSSSRMSPVEQALWKDVHEGKRPLVVNANNAAGILHLLQVLEPYNKVKLILISTGANLYQTLDQLKQRRPALILRPTIDLVPDSRDRVCVPRLVHEAGLEFAFSLAISQSELTAAQDAPLFPVGYMVKAGLPRDAALAALSKNPAKLLGLDKSHGSIEAGKVANLLVFDGDPFDPASRLEQVFVQGSQVHED